MFGKLLLTGSLLFAPMVDDVSTSEPTEEVVEESEWEDAKQTVIEWTTDDNLNGVPDKIEELVNEWKNTELVGGITLGAICSVIIAFLGIAVVFLQFKKRLKNALDSSDKSVKAANEQNEISKNIAKSLEETVAKNVAILQEENSKKINTLISENDDLKRKVITLTAELKENKNLSDRVLTSIQENSTCLKQIEQSNRKVDVLLDNQLKIASNNKDMVYNGTTKELIKRTKEVLGDEMAEEKQGI